MASDELILTKLKAAELAPLGTIISGKEDLPVYFVTLSVSRDSNGRQAPSNALLHSIARELRADGLAVEFLLRYENSEEIESGLRATVLHSHIDHIRNIFLTFESSNARVWLEPKHPLDMEVLRDIEDRTEKFLSLFDIELREILLTTEEILPTKLAMLTAIRQLAPASLTAIAFELHRRELTVPSPDWLVRKLDALRKSGHVVRLSGGEFALTRYSLHALGTAKNRLSPDISRLLALSKSGR
jgi:hypothetical protein